LTAENYTLAHLTYKLLSHYGDKCISVFDNITTVILIKLLIFHKIYEIV